MQTVPSTLPPLEWIESNGGPLLVLPVAVLGAWRGTSGSEPTDYDRARATASYTGLLMAAGIEALVLWGEPLPTAWLPTHRGGVLARWIYAPSDAAVAAALAELQDDLLWEAALVWQVVASPLLVIDSAEEGDELLGPHLTLELALGYYRVETNWYRPSEEVSLLLHRLTPVESAAAAS